MPIGGPFRELGNFLDACERGPCSVNRVRVSEASESSETGRMAADVELLVQPASSSESGPSTLCSPRIDEDGSVRFALETTRQLVPASEFDVDVELLDARIDGSGGGAVSICVEAGTPCEDSSTVQSAVPAGAGPNDGATDLGDGGHSDDSHSLRMPVSNGSSDDQRASGTSDDQRAGSGVDVNRDVPPFQDPELLADVYDSCETFAEMADAIDMDVTAETVRRYMIDFDIHQPNSYRTGGDSESDTDETGDGDERSATGKERSETAEGPSTDGPENAPSQDRDVPDAPGAPSAIEEEQALEPVVLSDGIGLPDDVTAETLIDTVKRSNTIYEVTQDIDLDRQDAFEMLHDLNLVDLVMGRLATEVEREITREEIVERLREASATQ